MHKNIILIARLLHINSPRCRAGVHNSHYGALKGLIASLPSLSVNISCPDVCISQSECVCVCADRGNPHSSYQRALLSSAATSALRVHQRMPPFQLSKEYFGRLFLEDSAHYLFYSLIFVTSTPLTSILQRLDLTVSTSICANHNKWLLFGTNCLDIEYCVVKNMT